MNSMTKSVIEYGYRTSKGPLDRAVSLAKIGHAAQGCLKINRIWVSSTEYGILLWEINHVL